MLWHKIESIIMTNLIIMLVQETQSYLLWETDDTAHSAALLLNQYRGSAKGFQEDFQEQNKLPAQSSAEFAEAV